MPFEQEDDLADLKNHSNIDLVDHNNLQQQQQYDIQEEGWGTQESSVAYQDSLYRGFERRNSDTAGQQPIQNNNNFGEAVKGTNPFNKQGQTP